MKFGTSGLRGLVSEMSDSVCESYAAAFVTYLRGETTPVAEVLFARDLRPSSQRIAAACMRAVQALGARAVDCGVVPTPALALEAGRRGVPAIMVTGSHIPFDRNGLKFYRSAGEIAKADEAGILAALEGPGRVAGRPAQAAAAAAEEAGDAVAARYVARYVDFFGSGCLAGGRIGVYQHSAAGRDLLVETLRRMGATVIEIGRTDRFVPVDTEAVAPEDAARFRVWVRESGLDALVSTDGDGDRPLVVDETGTFLRGDAVGALTARQLGADAVATPLNASTALERSGWFPAVLRTRIGSPYVIEGIDRLRAGGARLPVGYEANGGFLLGGNRRGRREDAVRAPDPRCDGADRGDAVGGCGERRTALGACRQPARARDGERPAARGSGQRIRAVAGDARRRFRRALGAAGGDRVGANGRRHPRRRPHDAGLGRHRASPRLGKRARAALLQRGEEPGGGGTAAAGRARPGRGAARKGRRDRPGLSERPGRSCPTRASRGRRVSFARPVRRIAATVGGDPPLTLSA